MKIRQMVAQLFHAGGSKGRDMTQQLIVAFRNSVNAPNKTLYLEWLNRKGRPLHIGF